jgi:hypothetical protein
MRATSPRRRGRNQSKNWVPLILAIAAITLSVRPAPSANVELAGKPLTAKIEGEIEPGDALKFLRLYKYYGPFVTWKVFLFSRGGDFEESIKLGKLIQRFRLETTAPDRSVLQASGHPKGWSTTKPWLSPASADNNMCASACVLIYAGSANRTGDALILHRPYMASDAAGNVSYLEYKRIENQVMAIAKQYLGEIGMPDYYIDRLVATSSRDGYFPSKDDLLNHPLTEIPHTIQ